jgi:hypothetical protein
MTTSLRTAVSSLIYELLDAHGDTVELATESEVPRGAEAGVRWQAHIDYLRALQRKGREVLACLSSETDDL